MRLKCWLLILGVVTLAGQSALPDPATGLVHLGNLGNGRYYDPALGRPLQPNPAGGAPTVPQSLNRYAAGVAGVGGIGGAAGGNPLAAMLTTAGTNALSTGTGMALTHYAHNLWGYIDVWRQNPALQQQGYAQLFSKVTGSTYRSPMVRYSGNRSYSTLDDGNGLINLDDFPAQKQYGQWVEPRFNALNDNEFKWFLRSKLGEFSAGMAINVALAYPELAAPWQNPYFNTEQRLAQNGVTILGAGVSAGAATWVGGLSAVSSLGGPGVFVVLTGTGIIVSVAWEYAVKPAVSLAASYIGRPDPYQQYRSLKPLRSEQ